MWGVPQNPLLTGGVQAGGWFSPHNPFAHLQILPLPHPVVYREDDSIVPFGASTDIDCWRYDMNRRIDLYLVISIALAYLLLLLLLTLLEMRKVRVEFPIASQSWSKIQIF